MREMHGSMMDAAGARSGDLPLAHARLAKSALPVVAHPRRAPPPLVPVARAKRLQLLVEHVVSSQSARAVQVSRALPALNVRSDRSLAKLRARGAVMQQWMSLQAVAEWLDRMGPRGRTLSVAP